jgi:prevent-host-death family protein
MSKPKRKPAEEARAQFSKLLNDAEKGKSTIITRHGRAVAVVVPMADYTRTTRQQPLLDLEGTGRGLWGEDSMQTIRALKDEWER